MPDPREAKLPKWAQDELRALRMRLKETQDAADTATNPPSEDTFPRAVAGYCMGRRFGVHGDRVRFHFAPGDWIEASLGDGCVKIMAAGRVQITMDVSNCFEIKVKPDA